MTTTTQLQPAAQQLLGYVQKHSAPISGAVQKAITEAQTKKGEPLNAKELEQVLVQAMPDQKDAVQQGKKACAHSKYHCDGKKADFLTQMIDFRIKKEVAEVRNQPATRRTRRDPLEAEFIMDNQAQVVLLFNARDVDDKGRPLLMKVVAREGAETKDLDLSAYRTRWEGDPDIQTVGKTDAHVAIKDVNETEFAFGDPLLQVSMDGKGEELSRGLALHPDNHLHTKYYYGKNVGGQIVPDQARPYGNQTRNDAGPQLDTTPARTFDDRIKLEMGVKDSFPKGGWVETKAAHIDAKLIVEPGLMFEPDSSATVNFLGTGANTAVPKDDAFLVGAPGVERQCNLASYKNYSIAQLLAQPIQRRSQTGGGSADANALNRPAVDMIFADKANIKVGAGALQPLRDTNVNHAQMKDNSMRAEYRPLKGDTGGQRLCLDLDKGFLSASEDSTVQNWKIVVGFVDAKGAWQQCDERSVKNTKNSSAEHFSLEMNDSAVLYKQNKSLEVRVFNAEGVPAQRVRVPLKQVKWADTSSPVQQS